MSAGLLMLIAALFALLIAALVILRVDTKQKQIEQRVDFLSDARITQAGERDQERTIRAERRERSKALDTLRSVLGIPQNVPHAHVIPIWLVFLMGSGVGFGSVWLAQVYMSQPVSILVGVVVAVLAIRSIFGWELTRYQQKLVTQIPEVIDMVSGAIRAGLPIFEAFRAVAREMGSPTREEFAEVINEIAIGAKPEEALKNIERRTGVVEYAIFAVTLAVQARSGGRLAETIQNVSNTIRERIAIAARARALAAEANLSAKVLAALPAISGGLMTAMQPHFLDPLFYDPKGKRLLVIAVVLLVLGALLMRRMINGVSRE